MQKQGEESLAAVEQVETSSSGKMDGSGRIGLTHIFQTSFFFFFQLQKQINDNLYRENELNQLSK